MGRMGRLCGGNVVEWALAGVGKGSRQSVGRRVGVVFESKSAR